jgi:glycosyltransferase involved in cell wall biosynthesis
MPKISCIICAYNEAKRIDEVLTAVNNHPELDEVLVINDGSTDGTEHVVEKYSGVRLVNHHVNQGKSHAIATGISQSKNDLLLFLDADLIGITAQDVNTLIDPVREGRADMSISLRKNSLLIYRTIGLDFVAGERLVPRSLLIDHIETIKHLPRFGIEAYMNTLIIKSKLKIKVVFWKNVISPRKSFKVGFWRGLKEDFVMIQDISKVISYREMVLQNVSITRLKV